MKEYVLGLENASQVIGFTTEEKQQLQDFKLLTIETLLNIYEREAIKLFGKAYDDCEKRYALLRAEVLKRMNGNKSKPKKEKLKIFSVTDEEGIFSDCFAAVVVAADKDHARNLLNKKLEECGIKVGEYEIKEISPLFCQAVVLQEGNPWEKDRIEKYGSVACG